MRPLRLGQPRLDGRVAPASFGHDRPLVSDDRSLPMTTATDGGLDLMLSAIEALVVVALVATKSAIVVVLRSEEGDFTLRPASPELFVATFWSQELRNRASMASVSQARPSPSGGPLGHSGAATPMTPVEVPPVEVPPSAEIVVPASKEATGTVGTSEDGNSAALEDFIGKVSKNIPLPLVDKPPRHRRVDPVLVDVPPQLPSSEAYGLRRSHRQALDPLSAVKPAKRGAVLLMRRLGEVGVPLPLSTSAEQAVDNFFRDPPPHHVGALQDMFPMLKNKSKSSPSVGWSTD